MGVKMIYLFEFYEDKDYQVHSVYEEYLGDTKEQALENLKAAYPDSLVLNTYIHTHSLGNK
jgi:hypothetical protein